MDFLRSFFKRITNDLKQKKLIPLKILFFVHASTLFVLYPYLTIHMRELGINVEETAIMSAVTPVVSIVMPPLAGMLADKIGNFRLLLALSSVLGGMSALLLLAVPVGRLSITFPPAVELLARCSSEGLELTHMQPHPCIPVHPYAYDVNLTLLSCGFVCEIPKSMKNDDVDSLLYSQSYDVRLRSKTNSQHLIYRHSVHQPRIQNKLPKKDQSASRIMTNDPYINTTVTRLSDIEIFFPTPMLYQMDCSSKAGNISCEFGNDSMMNDSKYNDEEMKFRIRVAHDAEQELVDVRSYLVKALTMKTNENDNYDDSDSVMCNNYFHEDHDGEEGGVHVHVSSQRLTRCQAACAGAAPRKSLCDNQKEQVELDPSFTFWTYLAVRVFIGIIGGTAFAMFEGAVIAIIREQQADYGLQRVYGSIGGMISSPLSGLLIDYASRGKGYTDFRPAFYLYAVLKVASGVLMLSIDLEFKQPAQNLLDDVISVLKNIEMVALFIACFIMGTAWGYIESFLFWLLQDLGASRSLMGITITVGGIAGLPLLVLSGPIIRRLGHANVLFIGFIFYAIRLLGYSLIYNPWLCLIFEALESVTSSLSFTAAVTYAARLSSTTTDTSVQGLLGGLYYGVGKGSGSLIGGYLMKAFGTRPTYQIFAASTLLTGCIYFLFNRFYIRKRATSTVHNDIYKKKTIPIDIECKETDVKANNNGLDPDHIKREDETDPGYCKLGVPLQEHKVEDGSSDSGVDNPAYTETETETKKAMTKPTEFC